jgi:hypothetical protein
VTEEVPWLRSRPEQVCPRGDLGRVPEVCQNGRVRRATCCRITYRSIKRAFRGCGAGCGQECPRAVWVECRGRAGTVPSESPESTVQSPESRFGGVTVEEAGEGFREVGLGVAFGAEVADAEGTGLDTKESQLGGKPMRTNIGWLIVGAFGQGTEAGEELLGGEDPPSLSLWWAGEVGELSGKVIP